MTELEYGPLVSAPITSSPGYETQPALSPDGTQVGFTWDGDADGNTSIYIQPVEGAVPPRPLTAGGRDDEQPAWAPDGDQIAFKRDPGDQVGT